MTLTAEATSRAAGASSGTAERGSQPVGGPYVLAVDVGSTGTRSGIYDAAGRPVRGLKAKVMHAFTTHVNGESTIDPDGIVAEVRKVIDLVVSRATEPIAGVALDTFASSLVGVDAAGDAITPCYTYADSRSAPQVSYLKSILDENETQQRTGTRQHTGYLPARFLWLQQTDPQTFGRVRRWLSLGEYVWLKLIGTTAAGTSTAAWTGMLNRHDGIWDAALCDFVGVDPDQLSPIAHPSQPLIPRLDVCATWPLLADAVWFAPISDGHSQTIGLGAHGHGQMVLSAATSGALRVVVDEFPGDLPRGLWCNRIDESRSLLGGALNDVGRAMRWLESTLLLPPREQAQRMLLADPLPGLPVVLPWFSGERSTGWVGDARAVFSRVSAATTPWDLYRGTMEGVAMSYARMLRELVTVVGRPSEILGTGRVALEMPGLLQIIADVTESPVTLVGLKRSTLHGTALTALGVLAPDAERAPIERGHTYLPDPSRTGYYHRRMERFTVLYDKLVASV